MNEDTPAVRVVVKSEWGTERIYPRCETAKIFARLVGQKTLTIDNVSCIQELGYRVVLEKEETKLEAVLAADKVAAKKVDEDNTAQPA